MRFKVLAASLALCATQAIGGPCATAPDADVQVIEEMKAAFLNAEYREFSRLLGPYFGTVEEVYSAYFPQLEAVFPDGFSHCQTVLRRRELPGFLQELVFYFPKGQDVPIALLIIAADVGGRIAPIEFNYNTAISEVLAEIK